MKILTLVFLSSILMFSQIKFIIQTAEEPIISQGETVWVDTLYNFPFNTNITGFASAGNLEWAESYGGQNGVAKVTAMGTSDQLSVIYVTIAAGKEIKIEYDINIFSGNTTTDQISMLWLPYQGFPFDTPTPDTWTSYDTVLVATNGINQLRFYPAHLTAFNTITIGDIWYFDNIRILGKQE